MAWDIAWAIMVWAIVSIGIYWYGIFWNGVLLYGIFCSVIVFDGYFVVFQKFVNQSLEIKTRIEILIEKIMLDSVFIKLVTHIILS